MYKMQNNLIIGKVLCRPKASNTPSGKENTIPAIATIRVKTKPFQTSTSTTASPKLPPTNYNETGKDKNHKIDKINELLGNFLACCPIAKPMAIALLEASTRMRDPKSIGNKIAAAMDMEPMISATDRLNLPHSPQEIPARSSEIINTPHSRQICSTG